MTVRNWYVVGDVNGRLDALDELPENAQGAYYQARADKKYPPDWPNDKVPPAFTLGYTDGYRDTKAKLEAVR